MKTGDRGLFLWKQGNHGFCLINIMSFILGEKLTMTQKFKETGEVIPLTIIKILPATITQLKTIEKDGYQAVQLGAGIKKKINKPQRGHLKKLGNFRYLKEFRVAEVGKYHCGQIFDINILEKGDRLKITGTSKGKGFQGVVKRHGFAGSPASHGHKDQLRMPGSIGSKRIGPVAKGKKMAGRMGGEQITINNLEVIDCDEEKSLLYLKGAVPGRRGSLVILRKEKE